MANYIDNKKMYAALCEYSSKRDEALRLGKRKPQIPNYIGECFLLISNRLATKPNFINYTYKEEMISDGIENCIMVVDNFDCDKFTNPFAYFTTIIYYAFLRRIEKEKKQTYIKYKSFQELNALGELTQSQDSDSDTGFTINVNDDYMNNLIDSFEKKNEKKKSIKKKKKIGLEVFYDEDEPEAKE